MIRALVCIAVALLMGCASAQAKCPLIFVEIEGEVEGSMLEKDDRVVIEMQPASNAASAEIHRELASFRARIAFDSTKSGGRLHHSCSRRPTQVIVQLTSGGTEVDRAELSFENDFDEIEEGTFKARSVLLLEKEDRP